MSGLKDLKNEAKLSAESIVVLVVGFHGAGKSSLICCLKEEFPDSFCVAASDILFWDSKDKRVENVNSNQIKLIDAIKQLKKTYSFIIFDGHLCVLNSKHKYEFVGLDVIYAVDPSMIILVSSEPRNVEKRLSERECCNPFTIENIIEGLNLELELARHIADELHIPLYTIKN